ncbi:RNA-binding domain superfamily [Sesbania bispinosa]|nr:RNA-binding domain superfamily [Sesbania bispinosa]
MGSSQFRCQQQSAIASSRFRVHLGYSVEGFVLKSNMQTFNILYFPEIDLSPVCYTMSIEFVVFNPYSIGIVGIELLSIKCNLVPAKLSFNDLPYSTGETTLQKEFSNFGKIAEVKMIKDVNTKRSKGYAFIQYTCRDDAMLALETMDQKDFYGRTIYVEVAKLGWDDFEAPPRTSGPPKKWNLPEQGEVVDCWY